MNAAGVLNPNGVLSAQISATDTSADNAKFGITKHNKLDTQKNCEHAILYSDDASQHAATGEDLNHDSTSSDVDSSTFLEALNEAKGHMANNTWKL